MAVPPMLGSRHQNWSLVLHPFEATVASKTRLFDESDVVGAPDFKVLLDLALRWLRDATPQGRPLFAFGQAEL
eukprot:7274001-Pyramimonas_sp.AAC.1